MDPYGANETAPDVAESAADATADVGHDGASPVGSPSPTGSFVHVNAPSDTEGRSSRGPLPPLPPDASDEAHIISSADSGSHFALHAEINRLTGKLADVEAALAAQTREAEKKATEFASLSQQHSSYVTETQSSLGLQGERLESVTAALKGAEATVASLSAQLESATSEAAGLRADKASLEARIAVADDKVTDLTRQLAVASEKADQFTAANDKVAALTQQLSEAAAKTSALTTAVDSANAQVAALTSSGAAKDAQLAEISATSSASASSGDELLAVSSCLRFASSHPTTPESVGAVVSVMERYAGRQTVQEAACFALAEVARRSDENKAAIGASPAVAAAVVAMGTHNDSSTVQVAALRFLVVLAEKHELAKTLQAAGLLERVYAAIDTHTSDSSVGVLACDALLSLVDDKPSKVIVARTGLARIFALMSAHDTDITVLEHACKVLRALCIPENAEAMGASGAMGLFRRLIKANPAFQTLGNATLQAIMK